MSTLADARLPLPSVEGRLDPLLLGVVAALLGYSLVMVFSVTVVDESGADADFSRMLRHAAYIGVGAVMMLVVSVISPRTWSRLARPMMVLAVALLVLVLLPGVGHEVNGSQRWLVFGPLRVQPSEIMKFVMVLYMADYLTRRRDQLRSFRLGVGNVILVVGLVGALLLMEPDLGTTVVLSATVFAMMYVAGVRISHMLLCVGAGAVAFVALVLVSPYRMQRVLSFQDPWADPYNSGFQLSNALIAFGRGDWFGTGLGQSMQKLFYLPHASNDFLAAVVAEELGFAGILVLLALYVVFLWRGFGIAAEADRAGRPFAARLCHGATMLIALQAIINLGVNMGVLPTKGLTLPMMSYGGSSMVASLMLVGLVQSVYRDMRRPPGRGRA